MPNWCSFDIEIEGDLDTLNEIWTKSQVFDSRNEAYDFDLTVHHPMPEDIEDWWEWRVRNWGCKWEPDFGSYALHPIVGGIYASGVSAWGPPIPLLLAITAKYPVTVVLAYNESGMEFGGATAMADGAVLYAKEFSYTDIPGYTEVIDSIPLSPMEEELEEAYDEVYVMVQDEVGAWMDTARSHVEKWRLATEAQPCT